MNEKYDKTRCRIFFTKLSMLPVDENPTDIMDRLICHRWLLYWSYLPAFLILCVSYYLLTQKRSKEGEQKCGWWGFLDNGD